MKKLLLTAILVLATTACAPRPATWVPAPSHSCQEDEACWNCLTRGNHICGEDWVPVDSGLADALAEGDKPDATTYDWESCLTNGPQVICPDGYTTTS